MTSLILFASGTLTSFLVIIAAQNTIKRDFVVITLAG